MINPVHFLQILFTLIIITFVSCTTVEFEHPQPLNEKRLSSFPKELIGSYRMGTTDKITITGKSVVYSGTSQTIENYKGQLSDTNKIVLKKLMDTYVLNCKDSLYWFTVLIRKTDKGIRLHTIKIEESDEESDRILQRIEGITGMAEGESSGSETTIYVLNPTMEQFKELLAEGIFSNEAEYLRVK